jgi:hypothetical protein
MRRSRLSKRDLDFWRAYIEILNERVPLVESLGRRKSHLAAAYSTSLADRDSPALIRIGLLVQPF